MRRTLLNTPESSQRRGQSPVKRRRLGWPACVALDGQEYLLRWVTIVRVAACMGLGANGKKMASTFDLVRTFGPDMHLTSQFVLSLSGSWGTNKRCVEFKCGGWSAPVYSGGTPLARLASSRLGPGLNASQHVTTRASRPPFPVPRRSQKLAGGHHDFSGGGQSVGGSRFLNRWADGACVYGSQRKSLKGRSPASVSFRGIAARLRGA